MEVPSLTADSTSSLNVPDVYQHDQRSLENSLDVIIAHATNSTEEAFRLTRRQATEVLVWLLSDVDRVWSPEIPHSIPVAYGMKGNSAPLASMRKMCNDVLQACHKEGIHISCTCFDGQYLQLVNQAIL